jgi:hypothetical protein
MTIQEAPIQRDEYGNWTHPDFPDWDEGATREEVRAWFAENDLVFQINEMEYEVDTDADPYFNDGCGSFLHWEPKRPDGAGWFALSMHDTEVGPVCIWAKSIT